MAGKERNEEKGGFRYGGGHSFSSRFLEEKKRIERESCRRRELGLERGLEKEQIFGNQRGRTKWRSLEGNNKGMISTSFPFFCFHTVLLCFLCILGFYFDA